MGAALASADWLLPGWCFHAANFHNSGCRHPVPYPYAGVSKSECRFQVNAMAAEMITDGLVNKAPARSSTVLKEDNARHACEMPCNPGAAASQPGNCQPCP
jgi:hypothetical protein